MRRSTAVVISLVISIVVGLSCIPWIRRQQFFSVLVVAITAVLLILIVYGAARWLMVGLSKSESTRTVWSQQRLRKFLILVPSFFLLVLVVPHFIASNNSVYKLAVATAHNSPQFTEALGSPVREGWFPEGKLQWGSGAKSEILIPVYGRARKGNLRAVGTQEGGTWKLEELSLELTDPEQRINLLRDHGTAGARDAR